MKRLTIVANEVTPTNRRLLEAARALGLDARALPPHEAERRLRARDVALGRLDVLPTLDGPEPGLKTLRVLEERGVLVLNRAGALLGVHDKLATALGLATRGLPHPRTAHVGADWDPGLTFPVVVKPRFGSWGRDVTLCRDRGALERCVRGIGREAWFGRQGALVQELVRPQGYDLRIVVAAGDVVGAVERRVAPGEWRTNVALGGSRSAVAPPQDACQLALRAASAFGIDLVGVDLLPDGRGRWVVLELNGAVDLTPEYSLGGEDVFAEIVRALAFGIEHRAVAHPRLELPESSELDATPFGCASAQSSARTAPESRFPTTRRGGLVSASGHVDDRSDPRGGARKHRLSFEMEAEG